MDSFINYVIDFVNGASVVDRFARYFENNERPNKVEIIADGVSDMSGRKTDIFMVYLDENGNNKIHKFDYSIKSGTTDQFGQVSAGGNLPKSQKKALSDHGWEVYKKIFNDFGVNVSEVGKKYLSSKTLEEAVNIVYYKAYEEFTRQLAGSDADNEKKWLKQFIYNINEHGTYNDPTVQLLQFERNKYYVLDFKQLNKLLSKEKLDIEVDLEYTNSRDGSKWPKLVFYNFNNKQKFITIRSKYSSEKMNNLIEKGPYLKKIATVRSSEKRKK